MKLSERFFVFFFCRDVSQSVRFVEESLDESKRSEGLGDDYSFQSKNCYLHNLPPQTLSIPSQL